MKHISQVKKVQTKKEIKNRQVQRKPSELKMILKYYLFGILTEIPILVLNYILKRFFGIANVWINYAMDIPMIFVQTFLYKNFVFRSDEKYITAVLKILLFNIILCPAGFFLSKVIGSADSPAMMLQIMNLIKSFVLFLIQYLFIRIVVFGYKIGTLDKHNK